MIKENQKVKVLLMDTRFADPENEIERELIKTEGLLDNLSIDFIVSEEKFKEADLRLRVNGRDIINKIIKDYDLIIVGEFDEAIKKMVLITKKTNRGAWAFQYQGKPESNDYLEKIKFYAKWTVLEDYAKQNV